MGLLCWALIPSEWRFYRERQFEHGGCTQRRGRVKTAEVALCKPGRDSRRNSPVDAFILDSSLQNWGNQYLLCKPPSPRPFAAAALTDEYSHITPKGVLSLKKEGHSVTCCNAGAPWGHCAKWNKDKRNQSQKDKYPLVPLRWGI